LTGTLRAIPLLASLLAATAPAASARAAPADGPDLAAFDRFARAAGPFCARAASSACFERSFRFADGNGDGELSLGELETLRRLTRDWTRANRDQLAAADRQGIMATLAVIELAGLPRLFRSYDVDGSGGLSRKELLADVRLDDRPLAELVRDPDAIDWQSLGHRLGPAAALLDGLLLR
jgi:Ca2+-binding EF-hand superfamily protein